MKPPDNYVINHHIPKEREGTYYTLPFPISEGLERVSVTYSYEGGVVDLGLMNAEKKFLGWSGSDKATVFVGPWASTPGYLMTEITAHPCEWHIIVGAYKIPDGGLDVRYEITYTPQRPRWLTGDLHIHSDASDGQHDIPTLAKRAKKKNLDFIAIANHNNYSENLTLPKIPDLTLIPAVEWTHYRGHMNFFGVPAPFENFIANTQEEMLELIAGAKKKDALVSVNHPKDPGCPYLWENTDCFDMVEVWNAPMRKSNMEAISWWHNLLLQGKKIPLVGGSDYHRDYHPALLAHPVTRVFAKSPSSWDILEALRNGHAYVAATPKGVELDLRCETAMMGDTIHWREGLELTISAKGMGVGMEVQLVTSEGVAHTWKPGQLPARVAVLPSWQFAYIIVIRHLFRFCRVAAISNPVFFINWD